MRRALSSDETSEARFATCVEVLVGVVGHVDRATPLHDDCTGLLMPAERKSVVILRRFGGRG